MRTVHTSKKSADIRRNAVIDLQEYRHKLEAVDGSLALDAPPESTVRRPVRTSRRARRRRTLSDWLEAAATVILIAVAVTVWLQLMF